MERFLDYLADPQAQGNILIAAGLGMVAFGSYQFAIEMGIAPRAVGAGMTGLALVWNWMR